MVVEDLRAYFRIEACLALAQTMKASPAQAEAEANLLRTLERMVLPILEDVIGKIVGSSVLPATPGATTSVFVDAVPALAQEIELRLADASVLEVRNLTGNNSFSIEDFSPRVRDALRNKAFEASQRTMENLIGDINTTLAYSYQQGLGTAATADSLRDIFTKLKDYELARIARTETNSTQNAIAHETIVDLGIGYEQWIATDDDRTRESHVELDGQIVRTGDTFSNGLLYPGDTDGELEEFINCRCRVRPYILPRGYVAPASSYFYEDDLIPIG